MVTKPSEKDIVAAWQRRMRSGTVLTTDQGEPVEVIYPGRRNDGHGADFQDAVITTGGHPVKGDIEVHVRSRDWISHRHHLDPAYNRVILHVVWRHDSGEPTSLCNGSTVPVLVLNTGKEDIVKSRPAMPNPLTVSVPCAGGIAGITAEALAGFMDRAGDERFFAKAAELQADLTEMTGGQTLYRGIMGALGYSRNKVPFLELADRLPLGVLESVASGAIPDDECVTRLQALLIGTAGLLPSQRGRNGGQNKLTHRYVANLEKLWSTCRSGNEMSPGIWKLSCTRPYNSPLRRLAAISYLINRYRKTGLLAGLWGSFTFGMLSHRHWSRMEESLVVSATDYWGCHFDFETSSPTASPTILGTKRAADIMVNVLLPFTYARGLSSGKLELAKAALDMYHDSPRLTDNALLKHMRSQLGTGNALVSSARRQQGLLHIYRTLCTQGRCERCPLFSLRKNNSPAGFSM